MSAILNIAAYRFFTVEEQQLPVWRERLKEQAQTCALKGTILLSVEGINLFLAGTPENIADFQLFLKEWLSGVDLTYRNSWSPEQPFKRLLVRIKKEIISMGQAEIQPQQQAAPYIEPKTLQQWYQEGRAMRILDTRNQYEIELGTFQDAINLGLNHFREFPQRSEQLPELAPKDQPIVTFCTGGIRCEKAALWLRKQGYSQVYQLNGGILNYLAQCGEDFFQGQCFVFDERIAIDSQSIDVAITGLNTPA